MPRSFSVSQGAQHLVSQQLRIASQAPSTRSLPDPNTDSPALVPLVCPMHRVALSTVYCLPTTPAPLLGGGLDPSPSSPSPSAPCGRQ